jgi:hypothetical protein
MFLFLASVASVGVPHVLDEEAAVPTASTFRTEIPTEAPQDFDQAYAGVILISFILGLTGIGVAMYGVINEITVLVEAHVETAGLEAAFAGMEELEGDGDDATLAGDGLHFL